MFSRIAPGLLARIALVCPGAIGSPPTTFELTSEHERGYARGRLRWAAQHGNVMTISFWLLMCVPAIAGLLMLMTKARVERRLHSIWLERRFAWAP